MMDLKIKQWRAFNSLSLIDRDKFDPSIIYLFLAEMISKQIISGKCKSVLLLSNKIALRNLDHLSPICKLQIPQQIHGISTFFSFLFYCFED